MVLQDDSARLKYPADAHCYSNPDDAVQNGRRQGHVNLLGMWWSAPVWSFVCEECGGKGVSSKISARGDRKGRQRLLGGFSGTIQQSISKQAPSARLHCPSYPQSPSLLTLTAGAFGFLNLGGSGNRNAAAAMSVKRLKTILQPVCTEN